MPVNRYQLDGAHDSDLRQYHPDFGPGHAKHARGNRRKFTKQQQAITPPIANNSSACPLSTYRRIARKG